MFAYVCVMEHPFYAVSGEDGTFKISDLPPGKYVIEALHRKAGAQTREITVGTDNVVADFTFEIPK